jgi:hypothetical protein
VKGADAGVVQAGLRPNPEFGVEIENIRWTRGPSATTETTSASFAPGAGALPGLAWEREREPGARSGLREAEIAVSIAQAI